MEKRFPEKIIIITVFSLSVKLKHLSFSMKPETIQRIEIESDEKKPLKVSKVFKKRK